MVETVVTHESQFEVWHQSKGYKICVFVIEINRGELIRRQSLWGNVHAVPQNHEPGFWVPPWADPSENPFPSRRTEALILRRWDVGESRTKSYQVANLFRVAELMRSALHNGKQIKPDYERKFKDHATRTKPVKKTNLG